MFTVSFSSVWNGQVVQELRRRKYLVFMTAQGFEVNMKSNRPYLVYLTTSYKTKFTSTTTIFTIQTIPNVSDVKWVAVSC